MVFELNDGHDRAVAATLHHEVNDLLLEHAAQRLRLCHLRLQLRKLMGDATVVGRVAVVADTGHRDHRFVTKDQERRQPGIEGGRAPAPSASRTQLACG